MGCFKRVWLGRHIFQSHGVSGIMPSTTMYVGFRQGLRRKKPIRSRTTEDEEGVAESGGHSIEPLHWHGAIKGSSSTATLPEEVGRGRKRSHEGAHPFSGSRKKYPTVPETLKTLGLWRKPSLRVPFSGSMLIFRSVLKRKSEKHHKTPPSSSPVFTFPKMRPPPVRRVTGNGPLRPHL